MTICCASFQLDPCEISNTIGNLSIFLLNLLNKVSSIRPAVSSSDSFVMLLSLSVPLYLLSNPNKKVPRFFWFIICLICVQLCWWFIGRFIFNLLNQWFNLLLLFVSCINSSLSLSIFLFTFTLLFQFLAILPGLLCDILGLLGCSVISLLCIGVASYAPDFLYLEM